MYSQLHRLRAFDLKVKIKNFKNNYEVGKITKKASRLDLICDFEEQEYLQLIESIQKWIERKGFFQYKCVYSESLFYGHLNAILDYANVSFRKAILVNNIKHGALMTKISDHGKDLSIFCMGNYNKEKKGLYYKPYFSIGPFIHYAAPFYSEESEKKIKEENGKTLLFFPSHTYEFSRINFDLEKNIKSIVDEYSEVFDSFIACIYWNDFTENTISLLRKYGFKIVSAGIRSDYNFLRRLKTIINLCDAVIVNDIGTNIGYSIYLNKPVRMLETDIERFENNSPAQIDMIFEENYNRFKKEFCQFSYKNSDIIITEEQKQICDPFWGFSKIRSKEEIRMIIKILEDIIKKSQDITKDYYDCVKLTLEDYEKNGFEEKHSLLMEALEEKF